MLTLEQHKVWTGQVHLYVNFFNKHAAGLLYPQFHICRFNQNNVQSEDAKGQKNALFCAISYKDLGDLQILVSTGPGTSFHGYKKWLLLSFGESNIYTDFFT